MDRLLAYPLLLAAISGVIYLSIVVFYANLNLHGWQASVSAHQESLSTTNARLARANAETTRLREIADQATAAAAAAQAELAQYRQTRTAANAEIEKANGIIESQRAAVAEARNQANRLTRENQALIQGLQSRDDRLSALSGENRSKTAEISRLKGQLRRKDDRLSAQTAELTKLRNQLRQIRSGAANTASSASSAAYGSESKRIELPHSGAVTLTINRPPGHKGSPQSMAHLEHAVRTIEAYMGQALPFRGGPKQVRVDFVNQLSVNADFAGVHLGSHIEILKGFDDPPPRSHPYAAALLAHEVAHYYWRGNATWLDEGAAEFLALHSENRRVGAPLRAANKPCAEARSLHELETADYHHHHDGFHCNYSLGEALFLDLFQAAGPADFQAGFRQLYQHARYWHGDRPELTLAFPEHTSVIAKWYNGRSGAGYQEATWENGDLLGYMTWTEANEWYIETDSRAQPCVTRLRVTRQQVQAVYDRCQWTGVSTANGDILVTIDGETYLATPVEVNRQPG